MAYKSILFADSKIKLLQSMPEFFQDLQLHYLLDVIQRSVRDYDLRPYFFTFPVSQELIEYRHAVFEDLSEDKLFVAVREFCLRMKASREAYTLGIQCNNKIQTASYHLKAATVYWDALVNLEEALSECKLHAEGFCSLRDFVSDCVKKWRERKFDTELVRVNELFSQVCFQLVINEDRITITEERSEENYLFDLANLLSIEDKKISDVLPGIFTNPLEPSYLEMSLVEILRKSKPELMNELLGFYVDYPEFYSEELLCFEKEVQFYLAFLIFKNKTEEMGYPMKFPQEVSGEKFSGRDLYDIALVWKNAHREYEVVSNDFCYPEHASFFVVTGPNQGGKTTFARSMGQSVYFSLMGLYANAASLTLPAFEGISTHFEVEESIQSNSGKLKDEIDRLAPMMHRDRKNQFVILNELFTTATTHDALIMGKKVMAYFLEKGCYGIYVTHIQELAEETDSIVSLVAQIEEGEENKRTYQMMPMQAQGYGYSDSLVKKFELGYDDLMRRLP